MGSGVVGGWYDGFDRFYNRGVVESGHGVGEVAGVDAGAERR